MKSPNTLWQSGVGGISYETIPPESRFHFEWAGGYRFKRLSTNRYFEYYWVLSIGLFDFVVAERVRF